MRNNQWPTREEWAEHQRAFYYDRFEDLNFDTSLSAYVRSSDVEALICALQKLWKAEGARMRAAAKAAGPLKQQPTETDTAYLKRWLGMIPEEQEIVSPISEGQSRRRIIKKTVKRLQNNCLPYPFWEVEWMLEDTSVAQVLGSVLTSYEAARKAAEEKRRQEILATPIDDAAWEEELQRRADFDQLRKGQSAHD